MVVTVRILASVLGILAGYVLGLGILRPRIPQGGGATMPTYHTPHDALAGETCCARDCGAQALYLIEIPAGTLTYCGHHADLLEPTLPTDGPCVIIDDRNRWSR